MKVKYKPWGNDNWVEFDSAIELVCPQCGKVKPIPFGWKPDRDIVFCDGGHSTAMFDITCVVGNEFQYIPILLKMNRLEYDNINEWWKQRQLWLTLYTLGDVPKWKVEPFPIRPMKEKARESKNT